MSTDERVLCVPRALADAYIDALNEDGNIYTMDDLLRRMLWCPKYLPRGPQNDGYPGCETDPNYLQLLPYVAIEQGGKLLTYQRKKGGEKRLDALWSIGIGGHISDADHSWRDGLEREIREEVSGLRTILHHDEWTDEEDADDDDCYLSPPLKFLTDFRPEEPLHVGNFHLGVLYVLRVPESVSVRYRENGEWSMKPVEHLDMAMWQSKLEPWSRSSLPVVREYLKGE